MNQVARDLDACEIQHGHDEGKGRDFIAMIYQGTEIKEFLPIGWPDLPEQAKRDAMRMCAHRCKMRLEVVKRRKTALKLVKKLKTKK